MKRLPLALAVCTTLVAVAACNDDDNHTPPGTGEVRVVNGISDSGNIHATATSNFGTTPGVAFDTTSSTTDVPEGSYNIQMFNSTGDDPFTTVNNVSIDHNNLTVLWTSGSVTANPSTATAFAVEENLSSPASGNFTFIFANDTTRASAATLSLYLVTPGSTDLSQLQPVASAITAGKAMTAAVPVKSGTYEIIITDGVTTLFDSGSTGIVLPVNGSNVIQMGALDATNDQLTTDGSPITLMVLDNSNNDAGTNLHLNGKN